MMDAVVNDDMRAQVAPQPQAGEPVVDRQICVELYQKLGRDAMLRQNDPVQTIYDFAASIWQDGFSEGYREDGHTSDAAPQPANPAQVTDGLHGPFGWLNGCRGLSEDSWELESDPLENNEEYFAIPLYALVDPFKEIGPLYQRPSATSEPVQVTDGDPSARFSRWLEEGPKLAKEAGCYVGIKVSDIQPNKVSRT